SHQRGLGRGMSDQGENDATELMQTAARLRFADPDTAQRLYQEAAERFRRSGSRRKLIQALKGLGQIARDLRGNIAALRYYEEAVDLCRKEDDELLLAHTVRHLGDIHHELKRDDLAEPCYQEALAIYRANKQASTLDLANAVRPFAVLQEAAGRI